MVIWMNLRIRCAEYALSEHVRAVSERFFIFFFLETKYIVFLIKQNREI
jgi:hypothetical protein